MSTPNLRKRLRWLALTWWEFLSLLTLAGIAVTTSFLVSVVAVSDAALLIIVASLTAVLLSLTIVIGLRRKLVPRLIWLGLSAAFVCLTCFLAFGRDAPQNQNSAALGYLGVSAVGTFVVAVAALIAFRREKGQALNAVFTWTNNGVSLIGILATALTLNFPSQWSDLGKIIGWIAIVATFLTLWPVWNSAAAAEADRQRADTAAADAQDAREAADAYKQRGDTAEAKIASLEHLLAASVAAPVLIFLGIATKKVLKK